MFPWLISGAVFVATFLLLESDAERCAFVATIVGLIGIIPTWQFVIQNRKVWIRGPWDIPSLETSMVLDKES